MELRWFRKHFVADQFVVVSWPGCTLGDDPSLPDAKPDDPRIERLAKYPGAAKMRQQPAPPSADHTQVFSIGDHGPADAGRAYFQAVGSAVRRSGEAAERNAHRSGRQADVRGGHAVGRGDQEFSRVVGRHVPNGPMPWHRKPGVLIEALRKCGIDPETARLGGPPVENVAIDEEGDRTLARLAHVVGAVGTGPGLVVAAQRAADADRFSPAAC